MKIQKLTLENFQGIRNLSIDFDGKNANIYGDNGTGKTTIYNAITWLLFDKASTGIKNFTPKTKGKDGQDIHYLSHSATAIFQLDNGTLTTFSKTLTENWKKKRGSITEEFSGHTTEYHIDGVPVSEREYNETIDEIVKPEQAKILTMTSYFPEELSWQNRRKILLEICGDITDEDVIKSTDTLTPLLTFLLKKGTTDQYYTVDEFLKIAGSRRAELNREIEFIPARIDEAKKAIPDLTGYNLSQIDKTIAATEKKKADLEQQKASLSDDTATQELRKKLSTLQITLNTAKSEHLKAENTKSEKSTDTLRQLRTQLNEAQAQLHALTTQEAETKTKLETAVATREDLATAYTTENEKQWVGDTVCYACGQNLPADQIGQAKEAWQKKHDAELAGIRQEIEATCSKAIIADLESKLPAFAAEITTAKAKIANIEQQMADTNNHTPSAVPFETTAEYTKIHTEIAEVEQKILLGTNNTTDAQKALQEQINALSEVLQTQADIKAKFAMAETQENRIEELMEQEKKLSTEYEHFQQGVYLCEEFIKTKVSLLNDSINSKFNTVSFRLFTQQINGGIKEDCEVLVPTQDGLVQYREANNAARINAGIEIIDTLAKHWGIQMPLFIDNRESVVRLADASMQVISLIVSGTDPALRVEVL